MAACPNNIFNQNQPFVIQIEQLITQTQEDECDISDDDLEEGHVLDFNRFLKRTNTIEKANIKAEVETAVATTKEVEQYL